MLLSRLWETLGKGFSFRFGLHPEEPELPDSDGRPGSRHTSEETFQLCRAETLKPLTPCGAPFLGIATLTNSTTRTVKPVCCVYVTVIWEEEEEEEKRKHAAVAETSVTFDVIEICKPFGHFSVIHNQCMPLYFWLKVPVGYICR